MKLTLKFAAICAAAIGVNHCWAINKCTAADGAVVFQDAPCSTAIKSETLKTWDGTVNTQAEKWHFERVKDDLTGKISCLARSPIASPRFKFLPITAVLVVSDKVEIIGLRTSDDNNIFHSNTSGMGMKTDNGKFTEIAVKHGQHVVGVSDNASMIHDLENSKFLIARVRFWPYEQLHDVSPISSHGFNQALKLARACDSKR